MRIAILSSSTFPAALCDDPDGHIAFYGSEIYNAYLVQALSENHDIGWWAPIMSSTFRDNPRVEYHPTKNSYGEHLNSELIEDVSFIHGETTSDLLEYDFIIDMTKFGHCVEELYYYNKLRRFLCYRSGHRDHLYPFRLPTHDRHYVLPNASFVQLFANDGFPADYVQHYIPDFWCPADGPSEYWKFFEDRDVEWKNFYLFSHRTSLHKGLSLMMKLVKFMPDTNFVFSTSTMLREHLENWNKAVAMCKDYPNAKFIQCPMNSKYHFYRRELLRGAKALMSPYSGDPYHDMGGYVSLECAQSGTGIILADTPESRQIWGDDCDGKSLLYVDGFNSAKMAIQHFDSYNIRGQVAPGWTKADTVNKYMELFKKYS